VGKKNEQMIAAGPEQIVHEIDFLAGEMKLLALNLAVALAKIQGEGNGLKELEPQFSELIRKAHDAAKQVEQVLEAFQNRREMICSLPASTEIIEKRGAYDKVEAKLNYIYKLSQQIAETLGLLKKQHKQVG